MTLPLSVLDLAPVPEGSTTAQSLRNSLDLARQVDAMGYHRLWYAEHHNMEGIASAATSVLIGQALAVTERIRVGSGGIMLPNHAPYVIAEQFGTLAELYPDRVDLGVGRAPGTDQLTLQALRRTPQASESFPSDIMELRHYLGPHEPRSAVHAYPGLGTRVPIWILGTSTFGAQLAAHLGLPYAFGSHFAPTHLHEARRLYFAGYKPSEQHPEPRFMVAINAFAAETDEEGEYLASTMQQAFARMRTGQRGKLPAPLRNIDQHVDAAGLMMARNMMAMSVTGSDSSVATQLSRILDDTQPDELIVTAQIHDHTARVESLRRVKAIADAL